jgi:hypothetical protein
MVSPTSKKKLTNLHNYLTKGKYRNALNHLVALSYNRNFIANAQSVPGLAQYLANTANVLENLKTRGTINKPNPFHFHGIHEAARLKLLIPNNERAARAAAAAERAQRQENANRRYAAKKAANENAAAKKAANAQMYNEAMMRLRKEAAEARAELAKAKAAKTHTAAANAAKRANAHANAAASAAKKASGGNAAKQANMEAKKAASAAKRATEEAEQKRINSLVGEHLQKIEKIMKNIQAEMNNMNKNNELSVKNETIARYRKLQKNIHAINPIYANIARTLGKNAKNQYPNLHSRILNLNQRIRNTINTNQLEARKYAAAQRGAAAGGMSRSARNQNWVLLGLSRTATKANVMKRFRNMSRSGNYMHPNRMGASGAAPSVQAMNAQLERHKRLAAAKNRIISNIERGL